MSLNVPCNSVPRNKFPQDNVPRNNVPHDNCSSQQLFHVTIVPRNNCSLQQLFLRSLQMVIYKEDGPPDDQNQGDGGAQIVTNDYPVDPASSVPLQMVICKEEGSQVTKIKGTEEKELLRMIIRRIQPLPFL